MSGNSQLADHRRVSLCPALNGQFLSASSRFDSAADSEFVGRLSEVCIHISDSPGSASTARPDGGQTIGFDPTLGPESTAWRDEIRLTDGDFVRLSNAFFADIEKKFTYRRRRTLTCK